MNSSSGSVWRKWDLHVHTPASIVQDYGGNSDSIWNKYLDDLESLPKEFCVLGINDYLFVDGYRRVLEEKQNGRLQNIHTLLPVIELRLDKFGGSKSTLSRVNFHIIFSENIDPDVIEQQFINALPSKYKITPKYKTEATDWAGIVTRESLEELGKKIIASVPEEKRAQFGSALKEGFNNVNFSLDDVLDILNKPYFEKKHLTAVGKTEWADIKWNDQSIADKKDIINSADMVFISAESVAKFNKSKDELHLSNVNNKLLDCSDAHSYSGENIKDRIGNCFTWIKSDTTFEGLKQALVEFDDRVYVGGKPNKLDIVQKNQTKYVKSISIKKNVGANLREEWFQTDLSLNHDLVAIIGNKGSGKSALADVLGLLGNTRHSNWFSFLNDDKFMKYPANKAENYIGEIIWVSGDSNSKHLNEEVLDSDIENVKYIPKNFFEDICNELGDIEESVFDKEIKEVIFSHVESSDRLSFGSLEKLLEYSTSEIYESIASSRDKLSKINKEITELEEKLSSDYRMRVANLLADANKRLSAHKKDKPTEVKLKDTKELSASKELEITEKQMEEIHKQISDAEEKMKSFAINIASVRKLIGKLENFSEIYKSFVEDFESELGDLPLKLEEIVNLDTNSSLLDKFLDKLLVASKKNSELLDTESDKSLISKKNQLDEKIEKLRGKLDQPSKDYEKYKLEKKKWEQKQKDLIGSERKEGSLNYYQKMFDELEDIPIQLEKKYGTRRNYSGNIFTQINKLKKVYEELYTPVQDFIEAHPDIKENIELNFDVSILNVGFEETFFDWINRQRKGSFQGYDQSSTLISNLIDRHNFNKKAEALRFLDEVFEHLHVDKRTSKDEEVKPKEQLRKGRTLASLYDYIFSFEYLQPRYILKMGDKELSQLSPGERGTLLLVFYLLVDKGDIPLIIDQPEHNLDNHTIYRLLVPAIKKAKNKRQIIIVTHNPNLAVVCDAEQIIYAHLDIKDNYALTYESGSIENPPINKHLLDVLEGTRPAFDNRDMKYLPDEVSL